ncbi:ArsR/SmtB family transcription factor [Phytohabitans rumicis]|uniref:Transcriptional regulator n=1 Tax=Phytohabitans rumicis TaxID=1076125 RepID=A0A6V8LF97_9ACTN|nr:helix-turn-helix domain-containing protein [Phytohabitans rumicis]GFJ93511.1 transcriptional regulator [Phytohabitans rumicis]
MRIHFTSADLARTFLADGPDPMWELVNSLQALQSRYGQRALGAWRRRVAADLPQFGLAGPVRHRLFPLAPHAPYFPDLLTPPEGRLGLGPGVEAVLTTTRGRLRDEIGRLDGRRGAGAWLADLSAGRPKALSELGDTMRGYYRFALAPGWASLRAIVDTDLAVRRGALSMGGVEAMLHSFQPAMRWHFPVLELPSHPSAREVHLRGRGLLLVPSWFCRHHPITIFDPELPQVVVYPVGHQPPVVWAAANGKALIRLLGETRAAVLLAARAGGTTGELAVRLGVSAATISHHTAILRDAGLITSVRAASAVRHSLTRLGEALVHRHLPD